MADTGAPSGAPGARQPQGSLEQQDHEHSPPQSVDILSERGAEDGAPERSQEEDTQLRESEASPVQLTRTSPEPSLGPSNETLPNPLLSPGEFPSRLPSPVSLSPHFLPIGNLARR